MPSPQQHNSLADAAIRDARAAAPERAQQLREFARAQRRAALQALLRQHARIVGPGNVTTASFRAFLRAHRQGDTSMTTPSTADTVSESEREIADLTTQLERERAQREQFKRRVRDLVIRQQHNDQGWCVDGINRVLRDLGLPEIDSSVHGNATIRVRFRAHTTDLINARNWAENALLPNSADEDVDVLSHEIDIELQQP